MKKTNKRLRAWKKRTKGVLRSIKGSVRSASEEVRQDRKKRTKAVYLSLTVGSVLLSYLLVFLNHQIFKWSENSLYGKTHYLQMESQREEPLSVLPVSLSARTAIYTACDAEGPERAVLPGEREEEDAISQVRGLWEETLSYYTPDGKLSSGESLERVLRNSRYKATLRDFMVSETGQSIAIWGAQAYYTAVGGRVYCLSAELDSRTKDVYSITLALYGNIDGSEPESDFYPMLKALGVSPALASKAYQVSEGNETKTIVRIDEHLYLFRKTSPGTEIYLSLGLFDAVE